MIILTIVRHGESTDNVKAIWAGWADAPLSHHGMNQAKALGASLSDYKVDQIYASDLLRATWTAQQIEKQQPSPPPLLRSPILREQNFGKAERKPFSTVPGQGYCREAGREFRFPEGESLDDVRDRANAAIAEFLEPILQANRTQPRSTAPHIFVVAHGIFNSELLGALLARRSPHAPQLDWRYSGMTNTGWTRVEVGYTDEVYAPVSTGGKIDVGGAEEGVVGAVEPDESSVPPVSSVGKSDSAKVLPALSVKITSTNVVTHLDGLKRQSGGIGSSAYDESQTDIRKFFGGAT